MDLPPPLTHVFLDSENVPAFDLGVIGRKGVKFTLLLGAQKKKLDVELVERLLQHAASVELVRLNSSGRNALDFALAYYLGRAAAADPAGTFHIVSKDTGYDPLVAHLQSRHIRVSRHDDFSSLSPDAKTPAPAALGKVGTTDEALGRVLQHLRRRPNSRPKRRKTLTSHLAGVLGKQTVPGGVEAVIEALIEDGQIAIDEKGGVSYTLP